MPYKESVIRFSLFWFIYSLFLITEVGKNLERSGRVVDSNASSLVLREIEELILLILFRGESKFFSLFGFSFVRNLMLFCPL